MLIERIKLVFHKIDQLISNVGKKRVKTYTPKYLEGRVTTLKECWDQVEAYHAQILVAVPEERRMEFSYFKKEMIETYEKKYDMHEIEWSGKIEELNASLSTANLTSGHNQSIVDGSINVISPKLVDISLPTFSGDIQSWPSFWDLFN